MTILPTLGAVLVLAGMHPPERGEQFRAVSLDVHQFKVLGGKDYDPENPHTEVPSYYKVIDEGQQSFIRGTYKPPSETVTLFHPVPDDLHRGVKRIAWRWRARILPIR